MARFRGGGSSGFNLGHVVFLVIFGSFAVRIFRSWGKVRFCGASVRMSIRAAGLHTGVLLLPVWTCTSSHKKTGALQHSLVSPRVPGVQASRSSSSLATATLSNTSVYLSVCLSSLPPTAVTPAPAGLRRPPLAGWWQQQQPPQPGLPGHGRAGPRNCGAPRPAERSRPRSRS